MTVLLIGDLPLAVKVAEVFASLHERCKIVGVLVSKPEGKFRNDPFDCAVNLYDFAQANGLKTYLTVDEIIAEFGEKGIDVGISCRASIIYSKKFIDLFKMYLINMHGGLLPERAGVNIACHAILEGDHQSGGTIHIITEEIDKGDIIGRKEFPISDNHTSLHVYQQTNLALLELISESSAAILDGSIERIPQTEHPQFKFRKYFKGKDLNPLKELDLTMTPEQISRVVRAFDFPGHEPAYFKFAGRKFYVTTNWGSYDKA